ncbi:NAD(P)/FAD-dependent oxidoreductase, partial [Citrobacter freundii]
ASGVAARPGWSAASRRRRSWAVTSSLSCSSSAAARAALRWARGLRQLGVSHIVIDRQARPGDQWRNRYKSLCLHDPVWYDHLPYMPFPDNWPVFAPKDKIGDWLEMYTKVMEVNYWPSTDCLNARFDEDRQEWEVTVERNGETQVLRPKHVVFATGMSGKANVPKIKGQDVFKGEQQHSSSTMARMPMRARRWW